MSDPAMHSAKVASKRHHNGHKKETNVIKAQILKTVAITRKALTFQRRVPPFLKAQSLHITLLNG